MNKHLRNVLTISATTLMMLGVGSVMNHVNAHVHACTTALNVTNQSADTVTSYIQKAENDFDVDNKASNDANGFLYDGSTKLFNHYYLNPCKEQQYKTATIGNLADNMNEDPDEITNSNKNNISNSLDANESTVYNDELSAKGAKINAHINQYNDSDNVPLTTDNYTLRELNYVNHKIQDAINDFDVDNKASDDANSFLYDDSGNSQLFTHHYSDPSSENNYLLATIGSLADDMNNDSDAATDANKFNIENALTSDELCVYNIRLGMDGAALNTYVNQSPYYYALNPLQEPSRPVRKTHKVVKYNNRRDYKVSHKRAQISKRSKRNANRRTRRNKRTRNSKRNQRRMNRHNYKNSKKRARKSTRRMHKRARKHLRRSRRSRRSHKHYNY